MSSRKKYSKEYKIEAVLTVNTLGVTGRKTRSHRKHIRDREG